MTPISVQKQHNRQQLRTRINKLFRLSSSIFCFGENLKLFHTSACENLTEKVQNKQMKFPKTLDVSYHISKEPHGFTFWILDLYIKNDSIN